VTMSRPELRSPGRGRIPPAPNRGVPKAAQMERWRAPSLRHRRWQTLGDEIPGLVALALAAR
jgi:hypothetical protein